MCRSQLDNLEVNRERRIVSALRSCEPAWWRRECGCDGQTVACIRLVDEGKSTAAVLFLTTVISGGGESVVVFMETAFHNGAVVRVKPSLGDECQVHVRVVQQTVQQLDLIRQVVGVCDDERRKLLREGSGACCGVRWARRLVDAVEAGRRVIAVSPQPEEEANKLVEKRCCEDGYFVLMNKVLVDCAATVVAVKRAEREVEDLVVLESEGGGKRWFCGELLTVQKH